MLLAHWHGCGDFGSVCYMDLKDESKSIHRRIQELVEATREACAVFVILSAKGLAEDGKHGICG